MATEKKVESEVVITNVSSKGDKIILDLATRQVEEPIEQRLDNIIEPLPKTEMEKMGMEAAKGYMNVIQKQFQESMQGLQTLLPPAVSPNIIRITLTKYQYEKLGKPTVFDKLTLTLSQSQS